MKKLVLFLSLLLIFSGCGSETPQKDELKGLSWEQIKQKAKGETINWMMWQGSPDVNANVNNYLVPEIKERFDINLQISSGQGSQVVSTVMTELDAGKERSEIDLVWINGETFYQLRQLKALYRPFTGRLPNSKYVDFTDPIIKYDFQQEVNGYESPWSLSQWVMIYNNQKLQLPPQTMEELEAYVKANPCTFTIPNEFTGMTFLKILLMEIAGSETLYGDFNQQKYEKYSAQLWDYINRIKPYFWKEGETFPATISSMGDMYGAGELNFMMTFGAFSLDQKVKNGVYPPNSRAYLWENGTILGSNYIGIIKHSAHKAAAMVVANFLMSPEAQFEKRKPSVNGSRTVLAYDKLPLKWEQKFRNLPESKYAPPRDTLNKYAVRELGPKYMIHIYEDFRDKVIQQ